MVELKVKDEVYLINPEKVLYVQLGDGTLPASRALSVWIFFSDRFIAFATDTSEEAKKLYTRVKRLLNVK